MAALVDSYERRFGDISGKTVVDVGCNDGSLLDLFRAKGARTIGIEPTAASLDAERKGHATFNSFLSEDVAESIVRAHGEVDIITFTNVFAHIEDLDEVLRSLRRMMSRRTVIIVENHYMGAVLSGNQFDTFYHEHPRTYSYTSFVNIARSLNTEVAAVEFPSRYGGNIRLFFADPTTPRSGAPADLDELEGREAGFRTAFDLLRSNMSQWRKNKRQALTGQMQATGKLRAKAFPGRAAILVKLLGLDESNISAVYEKPGSLKIGHYVPGTRVPISSDAVLFHLRDQDQPLLNLAWHISREIRSYLTNGGYAGPIIDVLTPDDFILGSK